MSADSSNVASKDRVIIIGGGFGGLATAVALHKVLCCGLHAPLEHLLHRVETRENAGKFYISPQVTSCVHSPQVGVPSIVLEKSRHARSEGFSIGVFTNGWRALDELGVGDDLRSEFLRMER